MIVINFQQLQGSKIVCWQCKNQNRKSQAQKNGQSCLKGQDMAEQWERFWRIASAEWKNVNEYLWPFVIGLEGCRDEIFAPLHAWLLPRIVNFSSDTWKIEKVMVWCKGIMSYGEYQWMKPVKLRRIVKKNPGFLENISEQFSVHTTKSCLHRLKAFSNVFDPLKYIWAGSVYIILFDPT